MTKRTRLGSFELPAKVQVARLCAREVVNPSPHERRDRRGNDAHDETEIVWQREPQADASIPWPSRFGVFDFRPVENHVRAEFEPVDVL
jgi:hypothetical protein